MTGYRQAQVEDLKEIKIKPEGSGDNELCRYCGRGHGAAPEFGKKRDK